jgi:hypothetical protein
MTPNSAHNLQMRTVYFIRPVGMAGPVKIGCSRYIEDRRDTLACWSPFALEIAASLPGTMNLERQFHARFAADHQRQEWFRWSPELQSVIDAVAAGTFDTSTLPPAAGLLALKKRGPWTQAQKDAARIRRAEWAKICAQHAVPPEPSPASRAAA